MIEHTHNRTHWANVYGRMVQFMMRPPVKGKNKYSHPVVIGKRWCRDKAEAMRIKETYEGLFV